MPIIGQMIICYHINLYNISARLRELPSTFYWSSMYQESSFSLCGPLVVDPTITIGSNFFPYFLLPLQFAVNSSISQIRNNNTNIPLRLCGASFDQVLKADWVELFSCKALLGRWSSWSVTTHPYPRLSTFLARKILALIVFSVLRSPEKYSGLLFTRCFTKNIKESRSGHSL